MAKNGYLARQKVRDSVLQDATRQIFQQYMTDTIILTLNDPEVMGKDVFGYEKAEEGFRSLGKVL